MSIPNNHRYISTHYHSSLVSHRPPNASYYYYQSSAAFLRKKNVKKSLKIIKLKYECHRNCYSNEGSNIN